MVDGKLPSPEEVLEAHDEIEVAYDLTHSGVRVANPERKLRTVIDDAAEFETVYARAAFLLRKLIQIHLFEDGNKRAAWVVMRLYLSRHNLEPAAQAEEVPLVLRRIRRYDGSEIATWLKAGDIDRSRLTPNGGRRDLRVNPLPFVTMSDAESDSVREGPFRKRIREIIDEDRDILDELQ